MAPLARFLPYQLSITSNAVSGRIAQEYRARWGLSVPEWRVMALLGDFGTITQRDLTRLSLMDKVAVNRACKVLEDRGLVQRTPNEQDGRSHLLDLTESGNEMHAQIMPLAREMERRICEGISEAELETFRTMLDRLHRQSEIVDSDDIVSDNFGIE
ncbi:MarR family winged helix-turn-helix transcriptional regulator [Aurantiacibacter suaedae]|uniref:MarR family winged helix-turn-helix transcriptional regulator n=1 Tax=Aurantiacibacter suaedae TaxID=2545755 RepID=UPI001F4FE493|nr:MarR family winged helix-turn-helix transcriptional regulator [Aurantiacibacter suaedae]